MLEEPAAGYRAAGWFWSWKNLNEWADCGDIRRATKLINGGYNGLEDRTAYWKKFRGALGEEAG